MKLFSFAGINVVRTTVILALVSSVVGLVFSMNQSSRGRAEIERLNEVAELTEKNQQVADQIAAHRIEKLADSEAELSDAVERMRKAGVKGKVERTALRRTISEKVLTARLLENRLGTEAHRAKQREAELQAAIERTTIERPDCAGLIRPADCPKPETGPDLFMGISIADVQIRTDNGNLVADGSAAVWECADSPCPDGRQTDVRLIAQDFSTQHSQLAELKPASQSKRWAYYIGVQWALLTDSVRVDDYRGSQVADGTAERVRVYGGAERRFKKFLWMETDYSIAFGLFAENGQSGTDTRFAWN